MSRHGKTEQPEITTVCDFERFGRIRNRKISGPTGLLVTALRVAAYPFELQIDETQIVRAPRYMGTQPQNPVFGSLDAGNLDGSRVNSRYRPFEGMLGYFPRLQPDECCRQIVGPTAKGLI
jgi:hypothetical protein